jgi:predicted metal-dependent enzyme (double-stranded beta helix superfamily)
MSDTPLARFTGAVRDLLGARPAEAEITRAVAGHLQELLRAPVVLPTAFTEPRHDGYAMYPLHVADDGSFSVAAAVWGVGQTTPIHDHLTWGVVGVVAGVEEERRYEVSPGAAPRLVAQRLVVAGDAVVCCRAGDDVHAVACSGDRDVVAIHVYGTDIGTAVRHVYDPLTGARAPFTSTWCVTPGEAARHLAGNRIGGG